MKYLVRVMLLVVVAALCFGGTFTCEGSSNSDSNPPRPPTTR
jgi:hypothetical protein